MAALVFSLSFLTCSPSENERSLVCPSSDSFRLLVAREDLSSSSLSTLDTSPAVDGCKENGKCDVTRCPGHDGILGLLAFHFRETNH